MTSNRDYERRNSTGRLNPQIPPRGDPGLRQQYGICLACGVACPNQIVTSAAPPLSLGMMNGLNRVIHSYRHERRDD